MEETVTPGWVLVDIGFEGESVEVGGVKIWDAKWTAVDRAPITVSHPSYPHQRHHMAVYEILTPVTVIRFAAGEFSNGVWGIFALCAGPVNRTHERGAEVPRSRREHRRVPITASDASEREVAHPYDQVFPVLAGIYLEDSWVLDVQADDGRLVFRLDAVLTPEHPEYWPPVAGQQHCYRTAHLVINCPVPVALDRSARRPARDATGELDFGNIDTFESVDGADRSIWRLVGDWGTALVVEPHLVLHMEG